MGATKHTPGPWAVETGCYYVGIRAPSRMVANLRIIGYVIDAENVANASLIAAAPDLLEALLEVEKFFVSDPNLRCDGWMADTLRTIRVAIAKARGEG